MPEEGEKSIEEGAQEPGSEQPSEDRPAEEPEAEASPDHREQQDEPPQDLPAKQPPAEDSKDSPGEPRRPAYFSQLPPGLVGEHGELLAADGPKLADLVKATLARQDFLDMALLPKKQDDPEIDSQAGKEAPAYFQQLPPDLIKEHGERLARLGPKIVDLAQRAVGQEGEMTAATLALEGILAGGKEKLSRSVTIPNWENPDPEELAAFYEALGVPQDGKYELDMASAEGIEAGEQFVESFKTFARDAALSARQAQGLLDRVMDVAKAGQEATEAAAKEATKTFPTRLRALVGNGTEDASLTLSLFQGWVERMEEDIAGKLRDAGLLSDTNFAVLMAKVEGLLTDTEDVRAVGRMGNYSTEWLNRHKKSKSN